MMPLLASFNPDDLPPELWYILLVLGLFFVPHILQRWRLPVPLGALGLGALAGMGCGWFQQDGTVHLLATFGIVSLFLLAGLEVDFSELRRHAHVLVRHLLLRAAVLALSAWALGVVLHLEPRPALIMALALLTPSVGFILSSLPRLGLAPEEALQVKLHAIGGEMLALTVLFFCVQSVTGQRLAVNSVALVGLIAVLPLVFWLFARHILPHAPRTEFAFLLIIAIACAWTTRALGAYYLLGAFIAGLVAARTGRLLPELVEPRLLHAIELFAAFFIPFYFFSAGLDLGPEDFSPTALATGGILLAAFVPTRMVQGLIMRSWRSGRPVRPDLRIATALLPTLVFTLVLARILRDQFALSADLYGALIVYALVTTLIPGFLLAVAPDYTTPTATIARGRSGDGGGAP